MVTPRSTRRRALLAAGIGSVTIGRGLAGCAGIEAVATSPPATAPATPGPSAPGGRASPPLLTPWLTLTGGWSTPALPAQPPAPTTPALPARLTWQLPIGVAARGDEVLVLDAGWRRLFRLERSRDAVTPLGTWGAAVAADHALGLHMTPDGGCWLAEPLARRVVLLDRAGRVRRELRDERFAARPVAVHQADGGGDVYVADAAEARIAVFDTFGRVHRRLGDGALQSVAAMAFGPQGLLVLDRLAQQVVVLGPDGRPRAAFGEDSLVQPRTLAADREGRVFVGDDADQRIKVFVGGERVASVGGPGNGPGRFGRVDALSVDGLQLYVADSLNARVQVLLIAAESMRVPAGAAR